MAYEIFISRGVASLPGAPQSIFSVSSTPGCFETKVATKRAEITCPGTQHGSPSHPTDVARANRKDRSRSAYSPVDKQLCSPRHVGGAKVSRTLKEGHALQERHETSIGLKSGRENSDSIGHGRTSEDRLPTTSFPAHDHGLEWITDQQSRYLSHDRIYADSLESCRPHSTRFGADVLSSCSTASTSSLPSNSTTPRTLSEGLTRQSGDKVYRHATMPTVTFVDGNLDASSSGGESAPILNKTPTDPKEVRSSNSIAWRVQFASPSKLSHTMASGSGPRDDVATTSHFLDPFSGFPVDLERQPSDMSDLSGYIRPHAFASHRDTLARIRWIPEHFDEDEGFETDEENSDQIPTKFATFDHRASNPHVIVAHLPAEILHEIFLFLQPCDFEAARHACRSWFVASLDRRVTNGMLRKAGCYSAFLTDVSLCQQAQYARHLRRAADAPEVQPQQKLIHNKRGSDDDEDDVAVNEHWLASKRLATESRLSAAWHGSSLSKSTCYTTSRMSVKETVNFQRLMSHPTRKIDTETNTFNVSTCGKFLLVIADQDILVYSLSAGKLSLRPTVRLTAHAKILKVSMDTSCRRFAVAALLEDRSGASWEIGDVIFSEAVEGLTDLMSDELYDTSDTYAAQFLTCSRISLPSRKDEITILADGEDRDLSHVLQGQSPVSTPLFASPGQNTPSYASELGQTVSNSKKSLLSVRMKPDAVYRNLGTPKDPPRSVAICPQRKCVAFGCKAGIELHWVDAITGNEFNRWFPLAAPSDHLYFLPQRSAVDSGKKLRLISSAASPFEQFKNVNDGNQGATGISFESGVHDRARSMTRLFFGNLQYNSTANNPASGTTALGGVNHSISCDHYRAVPLSDGHHMLFTDPKTGLLCLGSDVPLGGPTKLVRKACMVPPATENGNTRANPVCYAAGSDLRWGVRIVAAYDDGRIILYNVPGDCFDRLRHIRTSPEVWDEFAGFAGQSDLMMDVFMLNREVALANSDVDEPNRFRSLQIDGALLGYVDADVETLAVDSCGGGLRVWVFHASGQATQMDVFVPKDHKISSRYVDANGLIHDVPHVPTPGPIIKDSHTPRSPIVTEADDYFGSHVRFVGLDGCCEAVSPICGPMVHKHEIDYSDLPRDEGISMTPGASDDEEDDRPLQVELLTDWRSESLLRPYIVNVAWIEAH